MPNTKRKRNIPKPSEIVSLSRTLSEAPRDNHRCGQITCIHLTNFMCHSNLRVDLSPRVNFMVGSNGSGKSAILAALVLGLGATARTTCRSTSMKQLIKTGETSAKIEITLHNDGREAYEPKIYGKTITVVRTLTHSATTIIIKNDSGSVVSRKMDDLHRMLLYLNIQVDNPAFVLNQDSSREFLRDLDPEKSYQLFLNATSIDIINKKLNDCCINQSHHIDRLQCYQTKLDQETKRIDELRVQLTLVLSVEELKEKLAQHELELLWNAVERSEQDVLKLADKMLVLEKNRDVLLTVVNSRDQIEAELNEKIIEKEEQLNSDQLSYNTRNEEARELKPKETLAKRARMNLESTCDSIKNRLTFLEKESKELANYIVEYTRQNVDEIHDLRRKNEDDLKQLRSQYDDNVAIVESAQRDLKLYSNCKLQNDEQIRTLTNQKENLQHNLRGLLSKMENIKVSRRNALSTYGSAMTQLVAQIEHSFKAGMFLEMPRGPLGRYIEVPDGEQRNMIEMQLGGIMETFLVNNAADRKRLMALFKRFAPNQRLSLITMRFHKKVYNISNGCVRPPPGTHRLMDMIRCSDPVVMNCLIDRLQVERVLVATTKAVAEQHTSELRNVPKNLSKIVCCVGGTRILEYHPDPQYRLNSLPLRRARYLQVDVKELIINLEQEKQSLLEQMATMDAKVNELKPLMQTTLQRIEEKRKLAVKQETKKREILEQITALESFEYPETNKVELLHREVEENRRKIAAKRETLSANEMALNEAITNLIKIREEIAETEQGLQTLQAAIDDGHTIYEKLKLKLHNVGETMSRRSKQLEEHGVMLKEYEEKKEQKMDELNALINVAQKQGERIVSDRSDADIKESMQLLKVKLNRGKHIDYQPQQLRELIETSENALQDDKTTYKNIRTSVKMLQKSLLVRYNFVKRLRNHMVFMLEFVFSELMKLRNFEGKIDVNHEEKRLTITVIPRDKGVANAVGSTRALSGGERSFTTVVFLLALWSCVDHPFYFLDEYDVFTDEINREFMTRLLIKEGRDRPNRQFTFLTPQDLALKSEDFIKIFRLAPVVDDRT